ncbi:MAG: sensor domain-containing diguanylate cyclase [Thiomicrorhabdus sp.]|jgi:diguanylate cyclase (GGDEF)-like protein|nr:sensor domain-containing diguanylate cyclase [Thiomicrorhabdus sp.]
MLTMATINKMAGLSVSEQLEIRAHSDYLQGCEAFFFKELNAWLIKHSLQTDVEKCLLSDECYDTLISGEYSEHFYKTLYHQTLALQRKGLSQSQVMLMLSHCRKLFVLLPKKDDDTTLCRALCRAVDLGQSIVSGVYLLQELMLQMKQKSEVEVARMRRSFGLMALELPEELIQAYIDHQEWKVRVYSLALGDVLEGDCSHSIHDCRLGKWLDSGGMDRIPEIEKPAFQKAHERVHQLGQAALQEARNNHPERIIGFLTEMELVSDEVCAVLLECIEEEFVRLATLDALTGLPSRRAFDLQLTHNLAFAKRHNFWMGVILVDIDHFKDLNDEKGHTFGDAVLVEVANILEGALRSEDHVYRWGGEEFAILTLDKQPDGIEKLAERTRQSVESHLFCAGSSTPQLVTVSCGSICIHPLMQLQELEVFDIVDAELYKAKNSGRNKISHRLLNID